MLLHYIIEIFVWGDLLARGGEMKIFELNAEIVLSRFLEIRHASFKHSLLRRRFSLAYISSSCLLAHHSLLMSQTSHYVRVRKWLANVSTRIWCCSQAGDFGNENVDLVGSISNLEFTKAIILGNHDAWNTQKFSAREKDVVQLQLESLGDEHVGYRRLDFPDLKLSAVGGRPFSCGGEHVYRKKFLTSSMFPKSTHGNLFNIPEILLPSTTRQSKIF